MTGSVTPVLEEAQVLAVSEKQHRYLINVSVQVRKQTKLLHLYHIFLTSPSFFFFFAFSSLFYAFNNNTTTNFRKEITLPKASFVLPTTPFLLKTRDGLSSLPSSPPSSLPPLPTILKNKREKEKEKGEREMGKGRRHGVGLLGRYLLCLLFQSWWWGMCWWG